MKYFLCKVHAIFYKTQVTHKYVIYDKKCITFYHKKLHMQRYTNCLTIFSTLFVTKFILEVTLTVSTFYSLTLQCGPPFKAIPFQGFFNNVFFLCSIFRMSWFVVYSVMVSIVSLIGTILMHLIVLDNSRGNVGTFFLLFVLILEFGLSMIMFAFIMTTLFSKVFQSKDIKLHNAIMIKP